MKRLIISSLLVTLLLGSTILLAQSRRNFDRGHKNFEGSRIQVLLNLTDEQSNKFNDIRYNHQKSVIDIRAEIQKNRIEVRKMMADNKIDSDKLLQLTETNNDMHGKIKTSRTQMWLDIYNILNDDQKETWTKHFNRFGQRKNGRGFGRNDCMGRGKQGFGRRNFERIDQ
ncbi:MAG: Spy/CpxP family protein refolding chaperone [Bacteroidota bacterium]